MKCKEANKSFINVIEGNLSPKEQMVFHSHLDQCKECAIDFEQFKAIYQIPEQEIALYKPNPFMAQRVMRALADDETPITEKPRYSITVPFAISMAAAGIVLGLTIGTLLNSFTQSYSGGDTYEQLAEEFFPSNLFSPYELIEDEQ